MEYTGTNPLTGQTFINFGLVPPVGTPVPTAFDNFEKEVADLFREFNAGMASGDTRQALIARSGLRKSMRFAETEYGVSDGAHWLASSFMMEDGVEPHWGRCGRFIAHTFNCAFDVSYGGVFTETITVRPIYWDMPYVNETGFRQYCIAGIHDRAWDASLSEAICNTLQIQLMRANTKLVPLKGPLRDGQPSPAHLGPAGSDTAWVDGGFLDIYTEGRYRRMRQYLQL